ncbi:MAG: DUF3488 and transglutaminase-like domain-containing protein [Actinomycetota bacterium]|nr:DUF3488 and transglutaminase-like domain-containing protein [Actinomycetota bacterium]
MTGRLRLTVAAGVATLLATAPLAPLFDSWGWLRYAVFTVVVLTAANVACRRLSVPAGLIPLVGLGVLGLLVSAVFGTGAKLFGVLPTTGTLAGLRSQLAAAFQDVGQLAVPVPDRRGLFLLVVLGVGASAICIDALAVSLRRAAQTGLPMLAMFAVPVAVVRQGIGWLPFTFGAAGYLLLLLAEGRDRLSRWGRPFTEQSSDESWRPDPLEGSPMAAVGRRIGAAAIGLAVVIPALVPFVHGGGLAGIAAGAGVGNGPGGSAQLNPLAQLRGQLRRERPLELLRVKTNESHPFYLRVTSLDVYSAQSGWSQEGFSSARGPKVSDGLPKPTIGDGVRTKKIDTQVQVLGLGKSQQLPVYATPTRVKVKGDWRFDRPSGTVFSTHTNTRDLRYSFTSVTPDQSTEQAGRDLLELLKVSPPVADPQIQGAYGDRSVPADPRIQSRVAVIIKGKTTPYEKVLALYEYFRDPKNGFRYTTSTKPGNSGSALVDFLTNKEGYCEQYAAAMAVMARYAGIPARVAIGYTKGIRKNGYWSITTSDAHAWVEVYFQGIGWMPWDPTPLGQGGRASAIPYANTAATSTVGPGGPTESASQENLSAKQRQLQNRVRGDDKALIGGGPVPTPPTRRRADHTAWWLAAGVLALILLVAPALSRIALLRIRLRRIGRGIPSRSAHAAWAEVLATAFDVGFTLDEAETPRVTASRMIRQGNLAGQAGQPLRELAALEERARYARRPVPLQDSTAENVRQVRSALYSSATRTARWRAWLMPPSVLDIASRRGGLGVADALDGVDSALGRAQRALFGRIAVSRAN